MKIKGICKDCKHRWQLGAKGQPQHLYCSRVGSERVIKNTNMKSCPYYVRASEKEIHCIKARCK